jgi:hypothetical protein
MQNISAEIRELRIQSNKYNSPDTFAEYSLIQRKLNKLIKSQSEIIDATQPTLQKKLILQAAVGAGRLLIYLALVYLFYSTEIITVKPEEAGILLGILQYTPLRLFVGNVGIIIWIAICYRFSKNLIALLV